MKLLNKNWQQTIEIKENIINIIIIENQLYFRQITLELIEQLADKNNTFSLIKDGKTLNFTKNCTVIFDTFNLEINNKKIINAILTNLQKIAQENYEETLKIKHNLNQYFNDLSCQSEYNLKFDDEPDILNILKIANFKIDIDNENFLEKFLTYLKTLSHIANFKLIIILNSRIYFSEQELMEIYKFSINNKINILNIEYSLENKYSKLSDFEKIIIFDKDCCEL